MVSQDETGSSAAVSSFDVLLVCFSRRHTGRSVVDSSSSVWSDRGWCKHSYKKHVLSHTSSKHDKGWVRLPCKSRSPTFQLMRFMMLSQLLSLRILNFQGSGKCFWSWTGDKVWLVHLLPAPGNYPSYSSKGT